MASKLCSSKVSLLAPFFTIRRASPPAGRRILTLLAPPERRTGTTPDGSGSVRARSLTPPLITKEDRFNPLKSALISYAPPRISISQGTAGFSVTFPGRLRQSSSPPKRRV